MFCLVYLQKKPECIPTQRPYMPELPEVETIVRRLQTVLPGKKVAEVVVLRNKSFQGDTALLSGKKIRQVARRAKVIVLTLDDDLCILIHLKMTGQLIYVDGPSRLGGGHPTADFIQQLPAKHTRIVARFADDTTLFFNDQRVFGWWKVANTASRDDELSRYAPDVIDPEITVSYLQQKFSRRHSPIKVTIMDSSIISGVGNIYACDGLFEAGIDPTRPADSLNRREIAQLLKSLRTVILQGIELGGATIKDYMNIDGLSGGYQQVIRVYGREGLPCFTCGTPIQRIKQGGRSTYFCSQCQR